MWLVPGPVGYAPGSEGYSLSVRARRIDSRARGYVLQLYAVSRAGAKPRPFPPAI
jgi:hypothetical protein